MIPNRTIRQNVLPVAPKKNIDKEKILAETKLFDDLKEGDKIILQNCNNKFNNGLEAVIVKLYTKTDIVAESKNGQHRITPRNIEKKITV